MPLPARQTRNPKNQISRSELESGTLFFKTVSFRPATPSPSIPVRPGSPKIKFLDLSLDRKLYFSKLYRSGLPLPARQTRTPKNQIPLLRWLRGALFFKIVSFRPATPGPSIPVRPGPAKIKFLHLSIHARIRTHTHTHTNTHIHFCLLLLLLAACCYCYGEARLRRAITADMPLKGNRWLNAIQRN